MTGFPYEVEARDGPVMGLIVLRADETIEQDFRRFFAPDQRLHVTRVVSGDALTPDSIAMMEQRLPEAAGLLPAGIAFDAVGYACTSGTTLIGADRVAELVRSSAEARGVTDPLSATIAAAKALGIARMGIVSPYIASVTGPMEAAFAQAGITVPRTLSFGEEIEARVARITPQSIAQAAHTLAGEVAVDGVFLSCTNLRTLDVIEDLEATLGLPVLSSNQALAWHMARLSGVQVSVPCGRLFAV
ncbi:MAG: aspartate/glutamate racemase family protein [Rhodobacteraceae bacterium]|nr:aspartate/glutamate racemase family protein [Paracoccaceae bacterium]